jgi:hypothetical protein
MSGTSRSRPRSTAPWTQRLRLASVVVGVPPIDQTFDTIGNEATYFRALYLRAMPDRQLLALQQAGQRAWTLDPLLHTLHLSLLYSDIAEEKRRSIIESLDISLPLTVRFDAVKTVGARPPRSPQLAPDNVDSLSGGSPA